MEIDSTRETRQKFTSWDRQATNPRTMYGTEEKKGKKAKE